MSFRFQRRVSILPGVRLNFSRSGVSTTIGARGANLTLGGRYGPTANLGIPGSGLSVRVPLRQHGKDGKSPSQEPSNGALRPTPAFLNGPASGTNAPPMTPVQSEAVSDITTLGLASLRKLIIKTAQQRDDADIAVSEAASRVAQCETSSREAQKRRDLAEQRHAKLAASFFRRFRKGAIAAAEVEVAQLEKAIGEHTANLSKARKDMEAEEHRRDELWVDTEFNLAGPAHAAWSRLTAAFTKLSSSDRIWDITAYREKRAGEERSTATMIVDRNPVQLSLSDLPIIETQYQPLRWQNFNGGDIFIYPGFLIVFQGQREFAMLDLNEIQCNFAPIRFSEWEKAPSDSQQVGMAWRYSNRDGTPDRRYSDNPQTPVLLYGEIAWKSASGLSEIYMFSDAQAAAGFTDALAEFCNALQVSPTDDSIETREMRDPILPPVAEQAAHKAGMLLLQTKTDLFNKMRTAKDLSEDVVRFRDSLEKNFDKFVELFLCVVGSADGPINNQEAEAIKLVCRTEPGRTDAYYNQYLHESRDINVMNVFQIMADIAVQLNGIEKSADYDPTSDPFIDCFQRIGQAVITADGDANTTELQRLSEGFYQWQNPKREQC